MQLFTTQLESIQSQIEALQAERNRLQELENATAGALANLKAVIANVEGDENVITTLKSAINDLFEEYIVGGQVSITSSPPTDNITEGSKFGTPEKPCPATTDGKCLNPECEGETFTCEGCGEETPYCFGGDGDELCNDCYSQNPPPDLETDDLTKEKIQHLKELQENQSQAETVTVIDESDEPEDKVKPHFKKMFDGEPEPDDFNLVVYNDRVHRYENQIGIHFKLKREAKAWADQFEVKYHDCKIEIHKDDFESFGYVLKMTKGNPNDPQWWQEVTSYDYSKSPQENSLREKYHVLIQKNNESETVEIESSDEAVARKNYQHLVESIPDSYL